MQANGPAVKRHALLRLQVEAPDDLEPGRLLVVDTFLK